MCNHRNSHGKNLCRCFRLVFLMVGMTLLLLSNNFSPDDSSSTVEGTKGNTASTDSDSLAGFRMPVLLLCLGLLVSAAACFLRQKHASSGGSRTTASAFIESPISRLPLEERTELAVQGPTLVFDGVCHLCNGSMKWYHERSTTTVWYMWCQHDDSKTILQEFALSRDDLLQSWAYLEDNVVYRGSTAWLRAIRHLKRPWCWLAYLEYLVPLWIRETVYGFIARNRYAFFGKSNACQRPNKLMMNRMLHSLQVSSEQDGTIPSSKIKKRLLIVGCGPAGMLVAKRTRSIFDVLVVEPKDYFEFTPGILRGICNPDDLKQIQCPLQPRVSWVQGIVTHLSSRHATIVVIGKEHNLVPSQFRALHSNPDDSLEIEFDYCVVASGSAYPTSSLWKVSPSSQDGKDFSMAGRYSQITSEHKTLERLDNSAGTVCIVGAGLVGVEFAAEICVYFPQIKIYLVDLAPTILSSFPTTARDYAYSWLTKRGVRIATNSTLEHTNEKFDVVYSCVGVKATAENFMPVSTINPKGEIVVNTALQILLTSHNTETAVEKKASAPSLFGNGRIFAVGDCVHVLGLENALTKDTYPAEAMAGIVVKNLTRSRTVHFSQNHHCHRMYQIKPLMQMTLCSLGPHECIFIINGYFVLQGPLATFLKWFIQHTKMSEARNELLGTCIWGAVPHF